MEFKLSVDYDRDTPREVYEVIQRSLRVEARRIDQEYTKQDINEMFFGAKP